MASIRKEIIVERSPETTWAALRDWGGLHESLVPGFVLDTKLDGADRIVSFANGAIARERLVDLDEDAMRLSWTIIEGAYAHHNGVAQVFAEGARHSRFVWIADLLPNELAEPTSAMMETGIQTVKRTLESRPETPPSQPE